MLKVGINENVKLIGAAVNDKGSLTVSFRDTTVVNKKKDLLDSLAGTKDFSVTNFIIWPIKVDGTDGTTRTVEQIVRDLSGFRDQLEQILQGYVTSDKAELDPYVDLDVSDPVAFQRSVTSQPTVTKIYNNLATQFVEKVKEVAATPAVDQLFRLKLIRTSKAKHFGTLPKSFVRDNPFFESMNIPASASKVRFSDYEKKHGLDNPSEVTQATADSTPATGASAASAMLGLR